MRPRSLKLALAAADDDGISTSQTPGAAGNLTITGALAAGGVATLTSTNCAQRRVILTFAADETGHTFTIYGTRAPDSTSNEGATIAETVAGTTAGVVATSQDFATVTRVAIDAAATGAIKVGTNGVGSTAWQKVSDDQAAPFGIGFGCTVSGTVNYDIEHTFTRLPGAVTAPNNSSLPNVFDHSSVAAKTANADGNYAFPILAMRLTMNSGSGSVTWEYIQAGVVGGL